MKPLTVALLTGLCWVTPPCFGADDMGTTGTHRFIRKDLTYYRYDKKQPFYKRILGENDFSPYCDHCGKWIPTFERMIGLPVPSNVLIRPNESDAMRRLLDNDWSVLKSGGPIYDWYLQPLIFLGLGRCERCDGPFSLFGEIHGKATNGTIYFGGIFLTEIQPTEALKLLETAIEHERISNEAMHAKAVEFLKGLGSRLDFAKIALIQERRNEARALGKSAVASREGGNPKQALEDLQRALEIFEAIEDELGQAAVRQDIGILWYERGNLDEGAAQLTKALIGFEAIEWHENAAISHGLLGHIAFVQQNYVSAESHFQQALAIHKRLGDKTLTAVAKRALGDVYKAMGKSQEAARAYAESLELARETGDRNLENALRSKIEQLSQ